MKNPIGFIVCICLASILLPGAASAVVLDVVDGKLRGASDVDVDGVFYDVGFADGLFADIFGPAPEFVASSFFDTRKFSEALLASVLVDGPLGNFDSQPDLVFGCPDPSYCTIETPFAVSSIFPYTVSAGSATNLNIDSDTSTDNLRRPGTQSTVGRTRVFAVWTEAAIIAPVPEPGSFSLLALGLVSLIWNRSRRGIAAVR